jgi:hypothetical protein
MIQWIKNMFHKRATIKDLKLLYDKYNKAISSVEERVKSERNFIYVDMPRPEEIPEYHRAIAEIIENKFYSFWLSSLQYDIIRRFQNSSSVSPEFYRGQLALISDIYTDSKRAKEELEAKDEA